MVRVLLADDNISLRSALALVLETKLQAQVVSQVNSIESLLVEAATTQPDCIIVDAELPGRYRLSSHVIETLRRQAPKARIIIVSAKPESALMATEFCADGFCNKTDTPDRLLESIQRSVENG